MEFGSVVFVVKSGKFKSEVFIQTCAWTGTERERGRGEREREREREREHGDLINQSFFLKKLEIGQCHLEKC